MPQSTNENTLYFTRSTQHSGYKVLWLVNKVKYHELSVVTKGVSGGGGSGGPYPPFPGHPLFNCDPPLPPNPISQTNVM